MEEQIGDSAATKTRPVGDDSGPIRRKMSAFSLQVNFLGQKRTIDVSFVGLATT